MSISDLYGPKALQWADYWDSDTRYGRIAEAAEKIGSKSEVPTILQIIALIILIVSGLFIILGIVKLLGKNKQKRSK